MHVWEVFVCFHGQEVKQLVALFPSCNPVFYFHHWPELKYQVSDLPLEDLNVIKVFVC